MNIDETKAAENATLFGGGVGTIESGSAVLTQTAVNISLDSDTTRDEGATFGWLKDGNVALRLFSGASNAQACGTISGGTIQGVIDTAGYATADNAILCMAGNQTGLNLLDTTEPTDWRQAHSEFCCSQVEGVPTISCPSNHTVSCHYPHERLLTTVPVGNNAALLLTRQGYPYNEDSAKDGLLCISRLQLTNLTSNQSKAELDLSRGSDNGTLLFKPGEHHQHLLPESVVLAATDARIDHVALLSCTHSNGTEDYHLATVPLDGTSAVVNMTRLDPLKGRPVMLMFAGKDQPPQIWTHENSTDGDVFYLYKPPVSATSLPTATPGQVIAMGADDRWLYVAKRNQSDVVLERIDRETREVERLSVRLNVTMDAADTDMRVRGLPYTIEARSDSLRLIPQRTIWSEQGSELKVWQIKELPNHGGVAQWSLSEADSLRQDKADFDSATTQPMPSPTSLSSATMPPGPSSLSGSGVPDSQLSSPTFLSSATMPPVSSSLSGSGVPDSQSSSPTSLAGATMSPVPSSLSGSGVPDSQSSSANSLASATMSPVPSSLSGSGVPDSQSSSPTSLGSATMSPVPSSLSDSGVPDSQSPSPTSLASATTIPKHLSLIHI